MMLNKPISIPGPCQDKFSFECIDLLSRLLQIEPESRISFAQLESHPFIDLKTYRNVSSLRSRADIFFSEAAEALNAKDVTGAIHLYSEGGKVLMNMIHLIGDSEQRELIRKEVKHFTTKAEKLRMRMKSEDRNFNKNNMENNLLSSLMLPPKLKNSLNQGQKIQQEFEVIFRDFPDVLKAVASSREETVIHFLSQHRFKDCKNHLVEIIDLHRDLIKDSRFQVDDAVNVKRQKLLKEEILRLVSLAEEVMELSETHAKSTQAANAPGLRSFSDGTPKSTLVDDSVFPETIADLKAFRHVSSEASAKCIIQ